MMSNTAIRSEELAKGVKMSDDKGALDKLKEVYAREYTDEIESLKETVHVLRGELAKQRDTTEEQQNQLSDRDRRARHFMKLEKRFNDLLRAHCKVVEKL